MYVPFMPSDFDEMTPADSNLRRALTITERVILTWSAIFEATSRPSVLSRADRMANAALRS